MWIQFAVFSGRILRKVLAKIISIDPSCAFLHNSPRVTLTVFHSKPVTLSHKPHHNYKIRGQPPAMEEDHMTKHDLHTALSRFVATAQFCVQAVGLMLVCATAFATLVLAQGAADGIRYVAPDGSDSNNGLTWSTAKATLGGAQTSCPASGPCVIHVAPAGLTLSTQFTLNRAATTIECEPGAAITTEVSSGMAFFIGPNANDTRITGCTFNWSSGGDGALNVENTVSRVTIDHNLFENYPGGSGTPNNTLLIGNRSNTTLAAAVTDVNVIDNVFLNDTGVNINIQDYVLRVVVARNRIITGTSTLNNSLINAQAADSGTTMQGLTVSKNVMSNALAGNCIQINQGLGNRILDVTVSSNICMLGSGAGTGYLMAGITGLDSVGNVFDANEQTITNSQSPFEFVNVQNGTGSGNSAVLGTQASGSTSTIHIYYVAGENGGSSVNNTFSGNTASIAFTNTAQGAVAICWGVSGIGSGTNVISRNNFTGNSCDLTGSTGAGVGMFMHTNTSTTTVSNNYVSDNNFIGTNVTGDAGICVEQDQSAPMTGNVIGPNNVFNFHLPWCHGLGNQLSGLLKSTLGPLPYGSTLQQAPLQ
jgi:hypothetical protein